MLKSKQKHSHKPFLGGKGMATVGKGELAKRIAKKTERTKKEAEMFLNAFVEVVTEALTKGEKVEIRGFGTFMMKERAPRIARNPRTGKKIKVPAKLSPAFKPGKELKENTERVKE